MCTAGVSPVKRLANTRVHHSKEHLLQIGFVPVDTLMDFQVFATTMYVLMVMSLTSSPRSSCLVC